MIPNQIDYFKSDAFFEGIKQSILSDEPIGFGNPDSKLNPQEQLYLFEKMLQSGQFVDRDAFCNTMASYSTFQQACKELGYPYPEGQF